MRGKESFYGILLRQKKEALNRMFGAITDEEVENGEGREVQGEP
jgi:hypothetical protein